MILGPKLAPVRGPEILYLGLFRWKIKTYSCLKLSLVFEHWCAIFVVVLKIASESRMNNLRVLCASFYILTSTKTPRPLSLISQRWYTKMNSHVLLYVEVVRFWKMTLIWYAGDALFRWRHTGSTYTWRHYALISYDFNFKRVHYTIIDLWGIGYYTIIDWCWGRHGVLLNSKHHIDRRGAEVNMIKFTV